VSRGQSRPCGTSYPLSQVVAPVFRQQQEREQFAAWIYYAELLALCGFGETACRPLERQSSHGVGAAGRIHLETGGDEQIDGLGRIVALDL